MEHHSPQHPHIAIFGAGAVGLYLAGHLARGGVPVSLVARPASAAAIRAQGLTIEEDGETLKLSGETPGLWVGSPADLRQRIAEGGCSPVDVLLIVTKGHQIVPSLPDIVPLMYPRTSVAFLQNGIPWWYLHASPEALGGLAAAHAGYSLKSLDPEARLPAAFPLERVLGCVINKSAERIGSGHVRALRAQGDSFVFGAPLPRTGAAAQALLMDAFRRAGIPAMESSDIRRDVWKKLLGNAVLNPLSAIADATVAEIIDLPASCELARAAMEETASVARAYGIELDISAEERLKRARAAGAARTSMLQDKERGRTLEVDGILGGLIELAQLAGQPVPRLETLYAAALLVSAKVA